MRPRVSKTRLPATGTLEQSAMPEGATSPRLGSRQSTEFSLGDLRARRSVSLTGGRNSLELVEVDGFAGAPTGTDMAAGAHGEEAFRVGAPPGGVEDSLHEGLPSLSEGAPRKPSGLLYTLYVSKAWRVYPTLMLLYMGEFQSRRCLGGVCVPITVAILSLSIIYLLRLVAKLNNVSMDRESISKEYAYL